MSDTEDECEKCAEGLRCLAHNESLRRPLKREGNLADIKGFNAHLADDMEKDRGRFLP